MTALNSITEHGETFQVHPSFIQIRQLVRSLSEHKIRRDPGARIISRVPIPKRKATPSEDFKPMAKTDYIGKTFIQSMTGTKVEVLDKNIYGKLLIKLPDGNIVPIAEREFEAAFSQSL